MKPRVFLGSSVEGLSVAYAIQTNLIHDAEITVWSQGVFELSKTTIESLFEILGSVDFGVFVFTPDDLIKIRENSTATVRDNVLFEFGLFLGKLGRQRVFFIIPSEHELHLPTDLLGITPAKYESNREDKNIIAATGAASHQIRLMIKKYGSLQQIEEIANTPEVIEKAPQELSNYYSDFFAKKYEDAIQKIEIEIEKETDKIEIIELKILKAVCQYRLDEKNVNLFEEIISQNSDERQAYLSVASIMLWENYADRAIQILEETKQKFGNSFEIIELLAECHLRNGEKELAINCFQDELTTTNPGTSIKFANIYIDDKDYTTARTILHSVYLRYPNNKLLCAKYALVASELGLDKIALFFYDKLSNEESDNSSHLGYLGNACVKLELNDIALTSYKKANELINGSQEWILSNIGNLLKNRGFYNESIEYLRMALEKNESSEYALNRLSTSLKLKEDESNNYKNFVKEGRKMIKEFSASLMLNSLQSSLEINQ